MERRVAEFRGQAPRVQTEEGPTAHILCGESSVGLLRLVLVLASLGPTERTKGCVLGGLGFIRR